MLEKAADRQFAATCGVATVRERWPIGFFSSA
jgi:hypothetical protein